MINFYKDLNAPIVTSHGDFFDVLVFSIDSKIAEISKMRILQSMEVSKKAGAKGVIFHSNIEPFLTAKMYRDNWCGKNEEVFREICENYPEMNIYLENMFDTIPDDLARLGEKMKDVDNFGICFDYAHAYITDTPQEKWAEVLSPYIKHVHINDNDGMSDLHLAVGDGVIEWDQFYKLKEKFFNDVTVLIETTPIDYQKRSLKFLQESGYLGK